MADFLILVLVVAWLVDRARLHEYIGNAALKFFDANLGVERQRPN